MTIEEAVKQLESYKLFAGTRAREAIDVVLAALRAQQDAGPFVCDDKSCGFNGGGICTLPRGWRCELAWRRLAHDD